MSQRSESSYSPSRPPSVAAQRTKVQGQDVSASQVQQLKIQILQIESKTRQIKTQIIRLRGQTSDKQAARPSDLAQHPLIPSPNNVVAQLKRSIEARENTIKALQTEILEAKEDDRLWAVHELEDGTKEAFCEYTRISDILQNYKASSSKLEKELRTMDGKASQAYTTELRTKIANLKEENKALKEKLQAYRSKSERIENELELAKPHKDGDVDAILDDIDIQKAVLNRQISSACKSIDSENEAHEMKVKELIGIIQEQKRVLAEGLRNEQSGMNIAERNKM